MTPDCPVCRSPQAAFFMSIKGSDYWRCSNCEATFLAPGQRLSPSEERAHYLHHENDPDDPRYRKFLSRLTVPLLEKLKTGMVGLDYGCGPGPALAAVLGDNGFHMDLYDPFFYPDPQPLDRTYDFITCTETAEHFHRPAAEFDRLGSLLRPGGWLAVMTCFQTDDDRFANWHYRLDPTHVVFYRDVTLRAIAVQRGWTCEIPLKDVALMHRPESGRPPTKTTEEDSV